jgi:hypothetical protein
MSKQLRLVESDLGRGAGGMRGCFTATHNRKDGGKSCWGSGFLPTAYQGVEFRSKGDPVSYCSSPTPKGFVPKTGAIPWTR